MNKAWAWILSPLPALGLAAAEQLEIRTMTLRQAVQTALAQSPDIELASVEVAKANSDLSLVRAERALRLEAGSGLGATSGIPQSVGGASPSVAQMTATQRLIDPGLPRRAKRARAIAVSEEHTAAATREKTAYRAGALYLDFELASRTVARRREELERFERLAELAAVRVDEGREIPLELSRARLDLARARERLQRAESDASLLEAELRRLLGLGANVRLEPRATAEPEAWKLPPSVAEAERRTVDTHPELAALEARTRAAQYGIREARAARHPKLDLVGQYAMLARFNNYDDYFRRFQRHNWQAGVALQVPLFTGRGVAERIARARLDEREAVLRRRAKEADLALAGHRAYAAWQAAERGSGLAKQELEFARETVSVLLARHEEGLIGLAQLERARLEESAAWGAWVASQYALTKARLAMAYTTGEVTVAFAD